MSAHVPPQNIEAEKALLGALLVTGSAWAAADRAGLRSEHSCLEKHGVAYTAIADLATNGRPTDEISVAAGLEETGCLEDAGGRRYLSELAATTPAPGSAEHHAAIVCARAADRSKVEIGRKLSNGNGLAPAEAIERLRALDLRMAGDRDFLGSAVSLLSGPDPGPTPMLVERLVVEHAIAALVGSYKLGKTWLALSIAIAVATGKPLFGELEVNRPQGGGGLVVCPGPSGRGGILAPQPSKVEAGTLCCACLRRKEAAQDG